MFILFIYFFVQIVITLHYYFLNLILSLNQDSKFVACFLYIFIQIVKHCQKINLRKEFLYTSLKMKIS